MRNQKVLHNVVVPPCGFPPECYVTSARMGRAFYLMFHLQPDSLFICFPQRKGLGEYCKVYWDNNFTHVRHITTTVSLNETWGTWDDTLRSVAEAEKFAREQGYDTVRHYLVSDPTQLGRMWLIAKFNGIENIHCIRVSGSGRPWGDIFPHEVFSYCKVFLKGSRALLKRLWESLN